MIVLLSTIVIIYFVIILYLLISIESFKDDNNKIRSHIVELRHNNEELTREIDKVSGQVSELTSYQDKLRLDELISDKDYIGFLKFQDIKAVYWSIGGVRIVHNYNDDTYSTEDTYSTIEELETMFIEYLDVKARLCCKKKKVAKKKK